MSEQDWLAERFESDRPRLRAVARRMLGSPAEADDAVQETWIRLSRSDTSSVENLTSWLTTVVARVSLNMLQSRRSRREDLVDAADADDAGGADAATDPEEEALIADSVGVAMLVVLDRLTPAERLAFVLHDMFAVPFEEIATIVDRSPAAARKLASRARRRIQQSGADTSADGGPNGDGGGPGTTAGPARPDPSARSSTGDRRGTGTRPGTGNRPDTGARLSATGGAGPNGGAAARDDGAATAQVDKAELVRAFLAASRGGDFELLLATLDPDIVVRADQLTVRLGVEATSRGISPITVEPEMRGADAVTRAFAGLAWAPRFALIEGTAGLVWAPDGEPRVAFRFTCDDGKITAIDIQADLSGLAIALC
ncbi:sigma-70 family RNA polymerase sigma factor [Actinomadura sp. 9N215]|uniref:sigma-70 family RNA polymerase sigma factor n=1 Tax=Actinomadura sp. 9N215 TaxID=3375150 RepID=UPI0037A0DA8A